MRVFKTGCGKHWNRGGADKFICVGSGSSYCIDAYSVSNMVADSAIRYASKFDSFTNDVIQCNIDLRDTHNKGERCWVQTEVSEND